MPGICSNWAMNLPRESFKSSFLTTLLFLMAASTYSQDTTYDWVSTDGNPFDITATITLDSPSSTSGTYFDIVSLLIAVGNGVGTASDPAPEGFHVESLEPGWSSSLIGLPDPFAGLFFVNSTPFTWNPSTISSMDIDFNLYGDLTATTILSFGTDPGYGNPTTTGYWESPAGLVPDTASTLIMLFSLTATVLFARYRLEIQATRSQPASVAA
jgi:hypothetical protein